MTFSLKLLLFTFCAMLAGDVVAQSVYTERPNDLHAVTLERGRFGAHADGVGDDTEALQAAIDHVQETTGQGIVFLAAGRYRLSHTVFLWQGIRVIGYGAQRPVLVLGAHTPGYAEGHGYLGTGRYMVQFAQPRPAAGQPVVDANEFTFYSAMSNVDFEIGPGNPAAIAVRFHVAQHSFLSHMHFSVGEGRAAIEDVGNQASDLLIEGGTYGIVSKRTAPAWQFLLMDSVVRGQREAAVHTEEVGMTLVRVQIAHVPIAVEISEGMPEQLYGRDLLLRDIGRAAFVLGRVESQHHQVTLEHVAFARVKQVLERGEKAVGWSPIPAPSRFFVEDKLTLGQEIDAHGREGAIALRHHEHVLGAEPQPVATDIPSLPPMSTWANAKAMGAVGDGGTDDTAALQRAVEGHRVVYLPQGVYRLRGTLHLRADTVLLGLNPTTTQLTLWDEDPAFMGAGEAVPLVSTPQGGTTRMSGIGVSAGDVAPRAAGVLWRGGARSFMDDVNFPRGRGHMAKALSPAMQAAPASVRGQDNRSTQYPSLWVRDGGGGLFRDVWTADTIAKAGLRVENTTTPGVVYQLSCEHHLHNEVQFAHASHWRVYALQTEEEKPDGAEAIALELEDAHDLTFANQFEYRVSRNVLPQPTGTLVRGSGDIQWENMHDFSMTRLAFDNSVTDATSGVAVRTHDFTSFALNASTQRGIPLPVPQVFAPGATLRKLADGFSNASSLTVDEAGTVYFTDAAMHRVYRWDAALGKAEVVTDKLDAPQVAAFVAPSTLLVADNSKAVYTVSLGSAGDVRPTEGDSTPKPGTQFVLPTGFHDDGGWLARTVEHRGFAYAPHSNMATVAAIEDEPRNYFHAPRSDVAMIGGGTWKPLLQASQLMTFALGDSHLVVSENDDRVYRATLRSESSLELAPFFARSGTSVVEDDAGHVFVAGAQVFVYDAEGRLTGTLETPERPGSLAIGGPGKRTLFVGARGGLYAIALR